MFSQSKKERGREIRRRKYESMKKKKGQELCRWGKWERKVAPFYSEIIAKQNIRAKKLLGNYLALPATSIANKKNSSKVNFGEASSGRVTGYELLDRKVDPFLPIRSPSHCRTIYH